MPGAYGPAERHVLTRCCQGWLCACRGQIDVMHYLAHEAQLQPSMRVLFLTPCHATPWFSHVHANITMDFLDCSPPGAGCLSVGLSVCLSVPHSMMQITSDYRQ